MAKIPMNEKPSLFASFWAMPKRRPAAGAKD